MSQQDQYYDYQPSFNTGEISPEVANRTDLDKFKSALVKARNCYIRPYGAVYKRPGTVLCGETKYADKAAIIIEFAFSSEISYLLEIGDKYIRVWRDGNYTGVEVATPFSSSELTKLRFCQSSDTLFIASGTHNVQLFQRYAEKDWRISEMDLTSPYFDISNDMIQTSSTETHPTIDVTYSSAGGFTFTCPRTGTYTITIAGGGGGGIYFRTLSDNGRVLMFLAAGGGGNGNTITTTMALTANTNYTGNIGAQATNRDYKCQGYYTSAYPPQNLWPGIYRGNTYYADGGATSTFNGVSALGGGGGAVQVTEEMSESMGTVTGFSGTKGADSGSGQSGAYCNVGGNIIRSNADISEYYTDQGWGTLYAPGAGYVRIYLAGTSETSLDNGIQPTGTSGNVNIISSEGIFTNKMVGACVKMWHTMPSQTTTMTASGTSSSILVGDSWKILSHGNWGGTIKVQYSKDNSYWIDYRTYTSTYSNGAGDFNVSESGTFDEHRYIRMVLNITGGSCTADLSRYPYEHEGYAQITQYTDKQSVVAKVIENFGSTALTDTYAFSCWCEEFGYPKCVGFFQDRLVLAASDQYPYAVWMSRSGDYYNFGVEKADGTVTDDSAIMINVVNRNEYKVQHIVPAGDLIIFTENSEFIISGSSTVTPSSCNPKVQSYRGSTDVIPITVGSRIIYVQKRATTVREFAYSFDTDNYDGSDLTLLAKHLTKNATLVDATYEQDPDSIIYFVTSQGDINCLAYIADQKVYAWSTIDTKGQFEAVTNLTAGTKDTVYAIVKRTINGTTKRYVERFTSLANSSKPWDNIMVDMETGYTSETATDTVTGLTKYAGGTVDVVADGRAFKNVSVTAAGTITITGAQAKQWTIGLPYTMEIEQPNFEAMSNSGTQQGRYKKVSSVILRLTNSLGGEVGSSSGYTDKIKYSEYKTNGEVILYSGDKEATLPNKPIGGYLPGGRTYIKSDDPYPFYLNSIVRKVSFGG